MTTQATIPGELTAEIFIKAAVSQVYYHFSTLSGWLDWFSQKGVGNVSKDSLLQLHHEKAGRMAFFFQEFEPEKRVVFSMLTPDQLENGEVEIRLEETQAGTAIAIAHHGLAEGEGERLQALWQDSLTNLKELMEEGRDPRLWNRPFLGITVADWVTPEYAEKHGLATHSGMHINTVFEERGAAGAGISDGDTIVSLAGVEITDYDALLRVYEDHRAGDTIDVEFFHGAQMRQSRLTLSPYPVPEVLTTAHDIADKLDDFFQKVDQKIEQMLAGYDEAQAEYRYAAGEWNIKEILAHLIAGEYDSIHWLGSYLAGREVYPYISATPARLKSLLQLYPSTSDLLRKLRNSQKELVALINQIPAEVVSRKASMVRLSISYTMDISLHYKEHLSQISTILKKAADISLQ